jgi:hypothetical protein
MHRQSHFFWQGLHTPMLRRLGVQPCHACRNTTNHQLAARRSPTTVFLDLFLQLGSELRDQLVDFCNGEALEDLPSLWKQVCILKFMPLPERSVERIHAMGKSAIAKAFDRRLMLVRIIFR